MKRSVVMMACVLSGAMVLGSFSPVMAETGAKAVSATVTDSKSSDDKKDDAKADTHPCWGVPSPNPAPALRWFQRKSGVSHYIALSIPERAFIIFTGGRIWLK